LNNSVTNALHAIALAIYAYLAWRGHAEGRDHYTLWVGIAFTSILIAKILGVLVHHPSIENHRSRHNLVWILISIVFVFMYGALLQAIHTPPWLLATGIGLCLVMAAAYVRTLFTGSGDFVLLAIAMVAVNLLCVLVTDGALRVAWSCIAASNILWIALERVRWLRERRFHNDIYHFALIASTWLLYDSVPTGSWGGPRPNPAAHTHAGKAPR
jgi:hypothetical protein